MNQDHGEERCQDLRMPFRALITYRCFSSVHFSCSVVSDALWSHELQHPRPPCSSPSPRVHSDSRPSRQWCHSAISSSVVPFSSCPQSVPASKSSPMSQLFTWSGQSIGVSALASFLPQNTQDWSLLEWTGWSLLQFVMFTRILSFVIIVSFRDYSPPPFLMEHTLF